MKEKWFVYQTVTTDQNGKQTETLYQYDYLFRAEGDMLATLAVDLLDHGFTVEKNFVRDPQGEVLKPGDITRQVDVINQATGVKRTYIVRMRLA